MYTTQCGFNPKESPWLAKILVVSHRILLPYFCRLQAFITSLKRFQSYSDDYSASSREGAAHYQTATFAMLPSAWETTTRHRAFLRWYSSKIHSFACVLGFCFLILASVKAIWPICRFKLNCKPSISLSCALQLHVFIEEVRRVFRRFFIDKSSRVIRLLQKIVIHQAYLSPKQQPSDHG